MRLRTLLAAFSIVGTTYFAVRAIRIKYEVLAEDYPSHAFAAPLAKVMGAFEQLIAFPLAFLSITDNTIGWLAVYAILITWAGALSFIVGKTRFSGAPNMKLLAVVLNLSLLVIVGSQILLSGFGVTGAFNLFVFIAAPIASIAAFWVPPGKIISAASEIWPFVWFKRKAMEERARMQLLSQVQTAYAQQGAPGDASRPAGSPRA